MGSSKDNGQGGPASASLARVREDDFSKEQEAAIERRPSGEVASAQHFIQSRFAMAKRFPRDMTKVAAELERACRDTEFADDAVYAVPRGKKLDEATGRWVENLIEGLSVRFAEEAMNRLGNTLAETVTVSEDERTRIVRVYVTDLEANNTVSSEIVVSKTVERSKLKKDQKELSSRVNSYGDVVYTVEATDSDMQAKVGALVSKALRDNLLRFLPSWLKRKCLEVAKATSAAPADESREQTARKIAGVFADFGVTVPDLEAYLGHALVQFTPEERAALKRLAAAIRDNATTWAEAVAEKRGQEKKEPERGKGDLGDVKAGKREDHQGHDEAAEAAKAAAEKAKAAPKAKAPAPAPEPEAPDGPQEIEEDDVPFDAGRPGPDKFAPASIKAKTIEEILAHADKLRLDADGAAIYARNIGLPERAALEDYSQEELNRLLESISKEGARLAEADRLEPKRAKLLELRERVKAEVKPCPFTTDARWASHVRARIIPLPFDVPLDGLQEASLDAAIRVHEGMLKKAAVKA